MKNRKVKAIVLLALFLVYVGVTAVISGKEAFNYYYNKGVDEEGMPLLNEEMLDDDDLSEFEQKYNKMMLGFDKYVELNAGVRNILGQKEMNNVYKMDNGYLTLVNPEKISQSDIDDEILEGKPFRNHIENERLLNILYVTMPYSTDKYDPKLPKGVVDYTNENMDKIQEALQKDGVDTLDLRENLKDAKMDSSDLFFRTDHHWKQTGAFWAYTQIVDYMSKEYGFEYNKKLADIDNYNVKISKNAFLGTRGQRTGPRFAGYDDFPVMYPKFKTDITSAFTGLSGEYKDVAYMDFRIAEQKEYVYDRVYQATVYDTINNLENCVDKNVLVVGDSQSKALMPFFSMTFKKVFFLWEQHLYQADDDYFTRNGIHYVIFIPYADDHIFSCVYTAPQ